MISNKTINLPAAATFSILLLISVAVTYLIVNHGIMMGVTVVKMPCPRTDTGF